jgi:uncharacterized LabA/DUF88 family protein
MVEKNTNIQDFNSGVRVGVFVDVQNMYYSTKSLYESKLNYSHLLPFIANGRTIVVANAYVLTKAEIKTSDFINVLYENGFDVQKKFMEFKSRKNPANGVEVQVNTANWEIGIVIDMIKWAPKLDCIALVSGNGNYVDAVRYLKNLCRIEIFSYENSTAGLLKRDASEFIPLDDAEVDGESLFIPMKKDVTSGVEELVEAANEDEDVGNKK